MPASTNICRICWTRIQAILISATLRSPGLPPAPPARAAFREGTTARGGKDQKRTIRLLVLIVLRYCTLRLMPMTIRMPAFLVGSRSSRFSSMA